MHCLQALRRFEHMSSISIKGAAKIADLAVLAVELEEEAGAWRVSRSDPLTSLLALWFGYRMYLVAHELCEYTNKPRV